MTDDDKATEALDRWRRNSSGEKIARRAGWAYAAVLATVAAVIAAISLGRIVDQQRRIVGQQRDQAHILQIVKDATDPNSEISQRGREQIAEFGDQLAARFDAITKQRDEEVLQAARTGKPITFGPTPTLPLTTPSTTVPLPSGPRQNLGVATTVPKG